MNLSEGIVKKSIRALKIAAPVADVVFFPLTMVAAGWFRIVRFWGLRNMRLTKDAFLRMGVFPIVNHYYEPLFDYRKIAKRKVQAHLDFNDDKQLDFLKQLNFDDELKDVQTNKSKNIEFHFNNGSFEDKDARAYYSIIRKNKPSKIIEVGSGFSTLMALRAVEKNKQEDNAYAGEVISIEPYEMPYLESLNIKLIRKKVEDLEPSVFTQLGKNDILFIDSSHIIRAGGDVTHLLLSVLPTLNPGVWIHIHDIFLPGEYPIEWLQHEFRMWNEQYLLEALLTGNSNFEIIFALNYLSIYYKDQLAATFPGNMSRGDGKPGSFWIRKK